MICPNCGAQLPDGAAFCDVCGCMLNAGPVSDMNQMGQAGPMPQQGGYGQVPPPNMGQSGPMPQQGEYGQVPPPNMGQPGPVPQQGVYGQVPMPKMIQPDTISQQGGFAQVPPMGGPQYQAPPQEYPKQSKEKRKSKKIPLLIAIISVVLIAGGVLSYLFILKGSGLSGKSSPEDFEWAVDLQNDYGKITEFFKDGTMVIESPEQLYGEWKELYYSDKDMFDEKKVYYDVNIKKYDFGKFEDLDVIFEETAGYNYDSQGNTVSEYEYDPIKTDDKVKSMVTGFGYKYNQDKKCLNEWRYDTYDEKEEVEEKLVLTFMEKDGKQYMVSPVYRGYAFYVRSAP